MHRRQGSPRWSLLCATLAVLVQFISSHETTTDVFSMHSVFDAADVESVRNEREEWSLTLDAVIERFNNAHPIGPDHADFEAMGPMGPKCKLSESYGDGDDEKFACALSVISKVGTCRIISLGSNNQWGFEESIFNKTHCEVDTFDCTDVHRNWTVPENLRSRVRLHRVCIGDRDHVRSSGQEFVTYPSLLKRIGIDTAPTFLKMDIETFEYPVLRSMLASGLPMPLQIALEMHLVINPGLPKEVQPAWGHRGKTFAELAVFMDLLWRRAGYFVLRSRDNQWCPTCMEYLLARPAGAPGESLAHAAAHSSHKVHPAIIEARPTPSRAARAGTHSSRSSQGGS